MENRESIGIFNKLEAWLDKKVHYSGIKDKFGYSYQFCTARGKDQRDIETACQHIYGIDVDNFKNVDSHVVPGHLGGNLFTVRIRDINPKLSKECIRDKLNRIETYGIWTRVRKTHVIDAAVEMMKR
eukprot:UN32580